MKVDGITNAIKLQKDETTIYVLIHLDEYYKRCNSIFSKDINSFLKDQLTKQLPNKKYMFMIEELDPTVKNDEMRIRNYVSSYFVSFHKMELFKEKKENMTFAFFEYGYMAKMLQKMIKKTNDLYYTLYTEYIIHGPNMFNAIVASVDDILLLLTELSDVIKDRNKPIAKPKKDDPEYIKKIQKYLIFKLSNKYPSNIKEKHMIQNEIETIHKTLDTIIDSLQQIKQKNLDLRKYIQDRTMVLNYYNGNDVGNGSGYGFYSYGVPLDLIRTKIEKLSSDTMALLSNVVYIINRLRMLNVLRKFYIRKPTNCIFSSTVDTCCMFISFMVQNHSYKIVDVLQSSISDINELNKVVMNIPVEDMMIMQKIFLPTLLTQCADMSNFSNGFN